MKYFLGFDVGTNSSKGTLINEEGHFIYSSIAEHGFENPKPGYYEQDAERVWWGDVCKLSKDILANSGIAPSMIAGVGVSALGCDVVPVDRTCTPMRKAILYGIDARGMEVVPQLEAHYGTDLLMKKMQRSFVTSDCAPKILWLKEHEPEIWKNAYKFLTASSFLTAKLTGEYVVDHFLTSCFAPLYDSSGKICEKEFISYLCQPDQLPHALHTTDIAGFITAKASALTGLVQGTPVVTGTDDSGAEAISSGVVAPGDFMVQLGSTAFMLYCTDKQTNIPMLGNSPYLVPGTFSVDGGTNTAGNLTKWIRDNMYPDLLTAQKKGGENAYSILSKNAAKIPPGCNGLLVLPYFAGERVPINDPDAKGVIFGLLMNHTRDHIFRAALESVAYSIDQFVCLIKKETLPVKSLICTGGGAQNATWLQIIADVTGHIVQKPRLAIGASYGDALIAAIGTGAISGFHDLKRIIEMEETYLPDPGNAPVYESGKRQFDQLYRNNRELMHNLSN